jgi:apolipoprotein N-acyltransferase
MLFSSQLKTWDRPLALLLGVVMTLGFAPFDWAPLSVLALTGLFALSAGRSARRAALLGWLFGVAHFATGVYWTYISTHIYGGAPAWLGALLCITLYAYMGLYPAFALGLMARLKLWNQPAGWVGVPALWLLVELARSHMPVLAFPWLSLGDVALGSPYQRLAPLLGVEGIAAVMALLAYALYRLSVLRLDARVAVAVAAGFVALALVPPEPTYWTQPSGAPLKIAIIQGNIKQDEKWLPRMQELTLRRYRSMTLQADDADLILWPEVALTQPYHELKQPYLDPMAAQLASRGATLLAGVLIHDEQGGYYNSIVAAGASSGRYDKRHLVPFGEYFPIPDWLRPLMDVLDTPYSDLLFGAPEQAPITVKGQRIGAGICFEDVFADEYRRDAADSGLMVVATNDAWFGASGAAAQHLAMARMRALESGRVVLRASNTGVSAIIGPDGELQARSGFFTTETLRGLAQPRSGRTPYVYWGDAPLWVFSVGVILLLLWRRRRAK